MTIIADDRQGGGRTDNGPDKGQSAADPVTGATVPGMERSDATEIVALLQERLASLIDLHLTLKHVHWNVVGVSFIAVHEMLDPQVEAVQGMADAVAERIATLGGSPVGTPGAVVERRSWNDYELGRAPTVRHLSAVDDVYTGVVKDHRAAMERLATLDPVTEDLFVGHVGQLELFQWFVRAHLQDADGDVVFRDSER